MCALDIVREQYREQRRPTATAEERLDFELGLLSDAIDACNDVLDVSVLKGDIAGAIREYARRRERATPDDEVTRLRKIAAVAKVALETYEAGHHPHERARFDELWREILANEKAPK